MKKTTKFSFVISSEYLDGFLNSTINIIVTPCTAMNHCKEWTTEICTAWEYGFTLSSDSKSWEAKSSVSDMSKVHTRYKLIKSWVSLILCLGILLGFINGLLFVKSFLQDAWSIIHQMQMMLLLTLINGNAEYYAGKLILDCSFSAFSIFLFPVEMFKSFPLIRHLYTVEPDQHLLDLGVTTGSTVVSCIFLVLVLSTLVLVHLSALKLFQGQRSDTLKRLIPKMYSRVFIETFIFVMIASMFEIKNYNKNGSSLSIIFTLLILLYEAMFMLVVLLSWKRYSKVK